jgi:hypothetical protein
MINRIELEKTVNSLQTELSKTRQALNKSIAIESNGIELYSDGNSVCLKIYYNELELSIIFKKHSIESEYNGEHRFIPYESEVFDSNSNTLKSFVNSIQVDNTNDLLAVLRTIGLYNPEGN